MPRKSHQMDNLRLADGFPGQIFHFIPRSILDRERRHYLLRSLCVTDIGWYPRASHHFRERTQGADQHILIFCVRGAGWYEINGRRKNLKPRHALLIPRRMPHAYGATTTNPWSIHWVHFVGDDAGFYQRLLGDGNYELPVASDCAGLLERVFRQAYDGLFDGYLQHNIVYLGHALRHLLGLLFYQNTAYSPRHRAPVRRDLQPSIDYMCEHVAEPLRLADIARRAGLSPVHFSTLFRRQTGLSPIDYFIHLRMREACRLLHTTGGTVRQIAFQIGYEDAYYFSRLFKKVVGCPPVAYRQQYRTR
jgi:AraC family transcriptional regulator, arabinose operon regulatory protein